MCRLQQRGIDAEYKDKANMIYENASIDGRAKNSVEALLVNF